jgi:integrase
MSDGKPPWPTEMDHHYNALVKQAGVKRIRVHDLRHTFATLALADGIPVKTVSKWLGHSSIRITLDIYAHVIPEQEAWAAERIAAIFGG